MTGTVPAIQESAPAGDGVAGQVIIFDKDAPGLDGSTVPPAGPVFALTEGQIGVWVADGVSDLDTVLDGSVVGYFPLIVGTDLTLQGALQAATLKATALPTVDPSDGVSLWNDAGTIKMASP